MSDELSTRPLDNPVRVAMRLRDAEVNQAPLMWGRRLARLVGRRYGVKMSRNRALNEGMWERTPVIIKCAKSYGAPIQISANSLERVGEVWGVFLSEVDDAEVWHASAAEFKKLAYYYAPRDGVPYYLMRYKRFKRIATHAGTVPAKDVLRVEIP